MMSGPAVYSQALLEQARSVRTLTSSYQSCRRITRHHARSFYYASPVLPREKRRASYAIYAFCRVADDTVDRAAEFGGAAAIAPALAGMACWLDFAYACHDPSRRSCQCEGSCAIATVCPAWLPAFADTVRRFELPRSIFDDLLSGVAMDLTASTYPSFEQLLEYCHKVAGVVGVMMTCVFGYREPSVLRHAAAMGVAMQLTNICRDVAEDARIGRCYLPAEWLREAGLTPADVVAAGSPQPGAREHGLARLEPVTRRLIDTARRYFQYAWMGVPGVTDPLGRACILIMGQVYADILLAVEQQSCDPFAGRAHRTARQKLVRVAQMLGRVDCWLAGQSRVYDPWPEHHGEVELWWPDRCGMPAAHAVA